MFRQLKRLGEETAIYGVSTIFGRFLSFLLVPFYTNVLHPGEYGIVAYVYSLIAFLNVIYSYGMESAYFKYSSSLEIGSARQNFTTPFLSLFGSSIFFSLFIISIASPLGGAIGIPIGSLPVIHYAAIILALDAFAIIPFAALRMEHRAKQFALIKIFNIAVNVAMNLVLLLSFKLGITGVFISGVVASAVTAMALIPAILRNMGDGFNPKLWKELLKFGLPYIPSGIAAMAIQVIDRPILRALTDDATVGIYQANYRLGIFMMLIVSVYDYAWRPFYFTTSKEPNAKEIFARVLTYLLLSMSVVWLSLTFFIGDLAKITIYGRHIIGPGYWSGLNIVPVVLLGYLFLGVSTNLSAGIFIEKKTKYSPLITGIGAAVNVAANFLLIPRYGILGAAWATLLAYFAMMTAMYFFVQRIYRIEYEYSRLLKIVASLSVVFLIYILVPAATYLESPGLLFIWKMMLIILFMLIIYLLKFYKAGEVIFLRKLWKAGKAVGGPGG